MNGRPKSNKYANQELDQDEDATDAPSGKIVNKRIRTNVDPYARKDRGLLPVANSDWTTQLRTAVTSRPIQSKSKPHPPTSLVGNSLNDPILQNLEDRAQDALREAASNAIVDGSEHPPVAGGSGEQGERVAANDQTMGDAGLGQEGSTEEGEEKAWEDEEKEPVPNTRKGLPKEARKLIKELYDGELDRSAYTALLLLLHSTRRQSRKDTWGKKKNRKVPWTQEGSYECTTSATHRDKEDVALATPQEISAMILAKMKETAEAYLGHDVTHAVITVPAYFNDEQRQATKDAGRIAGLKVLRLLNEPTAAALAYGLGTTQESGVATTIVYDLGGGTFDVSLLRVCNGVFEVLATAGIARLGGEDFDNRIIDYFVAKYQKETATNIRSNKRSMSKLKREVERAKRALSSQLTARLEIESLEGGNDFSDVLTRAKFEELNLDLFQQTLGPISKVLADARLTASEIDHVVLIGGSTRISKIRQLLRDFFDGKEPEMGVNPDKAVAYGAAIQGSILSGAHGLSRNLVLVDVCPFTLGIATSGSVFNRLIQRNTPIPVQRLETFSTATNNQQSVLIQVYQGENDLAKGNTLLGTFKLTGIPIAALGVPQIEVVFALDANGILVVSAHDKDSGNSESITITSNTSQLDALELNRMTQEAQDFAAQDKALKERSQSLNELQQMVSTYLKIAGDTILT
ncbi:unnamed protein product [Rhizoctonia solani]|uniref:Uncharacterized protein n=1 Tax=Rhizoctonia solani TaxID=456999 RepID=A0A8H3BRU6_9AGAM|nr:unnamed protein product [Rhizoctonia solani]